MCGLLTGGSEECWWDCHIQRVERPELPGKWFSIIPDPSCLTDCYPADHCLSLLLADYQAAGGICRGSFLDVTFPGVFPVSNQACELYEISWTGYDLRTGLCSERTKQLLSTDQQNCIHPLYSQKLSIFNTVDILIESLCDFQTWFDFYPAAVEGNRVNSRISGKSTADNRLIPIDSVVDRDGVTIARVPPLHHTKNRYPWICSLRRLGQQNSHMCAVTLLSDPQVPQS